MNIQKIAELTGHTDSIYALVPAAKPGFFYSAGADGYIAEWNIDAPKNAELVVRVPQSIYALHFLQTENILLAGQKTGGLHVVDLNQRKETKLLQLHEKQIFCIDFFDNKIVCGSGDGKLSVINSLDCIFLGNAIELDYSIRCISNLVIFDFFAIGSSDGCVRLLKKNTFQIVKFLKNHTNSVFCCVLSPCGKYFITGGRDAQLVIYDTYNDFEVIRKIPGHYYTINHIEFSPCGNYFATASRDKSIRIWSAHDFELLKVIDSVRNQAHKASVNKLLWSAHNNYLISCGDDKKIMIWNIEDN